MNPCVLPSMITGSNQQRPSRRQEAKTRKKRKYNNNVRFLEWRHVTCYRYRSAPPTRRSPSVASGRSESKCGPQSKSKR
ncbi:hypothetical protein BCR44DRAFT_1440179 [Catenaria anguillulae PL171]|uniref:Uncharacterized protein n=1 Tax=Catenaria anguillulae PL171 TaxID=765915 RepID=A0A1Y2HCX4_9FUNG|nr:hypothetical protein BCR44DRAFT_1440179 [Catenaria anguillulae PL171]